MSRGFTKGANQKVKADNIERDKPAKKVMSGRDLRCKPASKK